MWARTRILLSDVRSSSAYKKFLKNKSETLTIQKPLVQNAKPTPKPKREQYLIDSNDVPPEYWKSKEKGNYLIGGTLLGLVGSIFVFTIYRMKTNDFKEYENDRKLYPSKPANPASNLPTTTTPAPTPVTPPIPPTLTKT